MFHELEREEIALIVDLFIDGCACRSPPAASPSNSPTPAATCWWRRARSHAGRAAAAPRRPAVHRSKLSDAMLERQFPEGTMILVDASDDDTVLTVNGERVGGRVELPMVGLDEPVTQSVTRCGAPLRQRRRTRRRRRRRRCVRRRCRRAGRPGRLDGGQRPDVFTCRECGAARPSGWATAPTAAPGTRSSRRGSRRRRRLRRAAAGRGRRGRGGGAPPAPCVCPTSSPRPSSASPAASPSSTSCSAAASSRARWSSSAASPASASPPCCCRRWTAWPPRGRRVLLVCGEESAAQVKMRAERICADPGPIEVLAETELDTVLEAVAAASPASRRRRLGADALLRRLHLGAGEREPGAARRRAASCASPKRPAPPSSSSAT